jgi:hypothetical protein
MLELIWGQVQTRLHERMIQHAILFAAHHEREASQIGQHGSGAILPIQPKQNRLLRQLVRSEVATDGRESQAQFREGCARCLGYQTCRADFQLWAWLTTVRVRTTSPRLRPV